jgi:hypothetical protein
LVESIPGRLKSPPSHRCAPLCVGILARYDSGEGGGVCILVSKKYESEEPVELKVENNCELVCTQIKVRGSKDIKL